MEKFSIYAQLMVKLSICCCIKLCLRCFVQIDHGSVLTPIHYMHEQKHTNLSSKMLQICWQSKLKDLKETLRMLLKSGTSGNIVYIQAPHPLNMFLFFLVF